MGDTWFVDLNVRYDAAESATLGRWLSGTYVAVGVSDLFDNEPPYSYGVTPYDPFVYDIRGRLMHLQVGLKW